MPRLSSLVLSLLGCLLIEGNQAGARVRTIEAGRNAIGSAALQASPGDTLLLVTDGGVYREDTSILLPNVPLTIMSESARSGRPRWTSEGTRHLKVMNDLVVRGIHFDGRHKTKNAIRSYAPRPNTILVEDCIFSGFTEDGITDDDVPVENCTVRQSSFHDIRKVAIEFRTADMCRNLVVENCTFYRLGEHAVHISEERERLQVRISNVTIHGSNGGLYLNGVSNAVVTNSIITGCRVYGIRSVSPATLTRVGTFGNTRDYDVCPAGEGCFNADPRYYDADNGDFSLLPGSPCLSVEPAGGAIGDLRWAGGASVRAGRLQLLHVGGKALGIVSLAAGLLAGVIMYVRRRVQRADERRHLKVLAMSTLKAQEDERRHMSRELHDQVGQELVSVGIQLEMLRSRQELRGCVDDIARITSGLEAATRSIREISHELRPMMLDDLGLRPTLQWYVGVFSQRTGLGVSLDLSGMDEVSDRDLATTLYRTVQEALTNVARHARATRISILGRSTPEAVSLSIEDDGTGFDPERHMMTAGTGPGIGLMNMRERVQGLGGSLQIESRAGFGTRLRIELPTPEE